MREVIYSNVFNKDLKLCMKRKYDISLLMTVVDMLRTSDILPLKYKDHLLLGEYSGYRECHIKGNWLLIYFIDDNDILYLHRTGTHTDLFKKY